MMENWIDDLARVWETITDQRFGNVYSFKLIEKAEFPDAINPKELDLHPIAFTIPMSMQPTYSLSTKEAFSYGVTQFHVSPDASMSRVPGLIPWFGKILRAAAANVTLGGKVHNFVIENEQNGILGPVELQYGSEAVHWGFIVNWRVKENPLSDLVVSP